MPRRGGGVFKTLQALAHPQQRINSPATIRSPSAFNCGLVSRMPDTFIGCWAVALALAVVAVAPRGTAAAFSCVPEGIYDSQRVTGGVLYNPYLELCRSDAAKLVAAIPTAEFYCVSAAASSADIHSWCCFRSWDRDRGGVQVGWCACVQPPPALPAAMHTWQWADSPESPTQYTYLYSFAGF